MLKRCCNKFCKNNLKNCKTEGENRVITKNIRLNSPTGPTGPIGPTGPTGPTGATGATGANGNPEIIRAGIVKTLNPGENASVNDRFEDGKHFMDFGIPCGNSGEKGEKGETGERGEKGDTGPQGPTGPKGEPGEIGKSELISIDGVESVESDEQAQVLDDFEDNIHHLKFYIPKGVAGANGEKGDPGEKGQDGEKGETGDTGPQGPQGERGEKGERGATGPEEILGALILSYNSDPNSFPTGGEEIASNARLPLWRCELDKGKIVSLDNVENIFKMNQTGTYKVTFTVNAYTKKTGTDFDSSTDFVAIALRQVGTDNILAAANTWSFNEAAENIYGQGIFTVDNIENTYELVNVHTKSVFINGVDITKTISHSYFAVPMLSIVITKLY